MLPIVAVVGRPNVGKSTLFNRMLGKRISIVDDRPGVTRDRLTSFCQAEDTFFELVDTGGFGIEELDHLSKDIERQIAVAIEKASLILFVVDVQSGVTKLDTDLANVLRKAQKTVLLVANKTDNQMLSYQSAEFARLGMGEPISFSALHGKGKSELLEEIAKHLPSDSVIPPDPVMKVAMVGARNVGKSTFINTLAGEERVIVSELPGTTRDSVDVRFEIGDKTFLAIDTAGVKKKGKIKDNVEFYSFARAERSIRRADVILLMIDATEHLGQVTKKLAGFVFDNFKPCVIVINKWDLVQGQADIEDYQDYLEKTLKSFPFAPISVTCATDGTNIMDTMKVAEALFKQTQIRLSTSRLNRAIEMIRKSKPPSSTRAKGRPRFYYATQIDVAPPTIVMFVNDLESFDYNYKRFVINRMRELLPFKEIPIRVLLRRRTEGTRAPTD